MKAIPLLFTNRGLFVVRRLDAGTYLESFFVAAVAAVLVIRLFLELTGYPQIGGGGLHIAHMLWGGLLMFAAIAIQFSFLGRAAERGAALVGGVGFGTFIDEVGKFITSDNDYFYRPAVAVIYVCFVLVFMILRAVQTRQNFTQSEYLVGALRSAEEIALRDLDEEERRFALAYLERSDAGNPLVAALREALTNVALVERRPANLITRVKRTISDLYLFVARLWWFPVFVIIFFLGKLLVTLLYVFVLIFIFGLGWNEIFDLRVVGRIVGSVQNLSLINWLGIGCSLLSGLFVLIGVVLMRRSTLRAYKMFERSVIVSILLTQVFAFYEEQFSALFGLVINIMILIALRFIIEQEQTTSDATERDAASTRTKSLPQPHVAAK